jgi:glycopeptide antibiotics resistance protein
MRRVIATCLEWSPAVSRWMFIPCLLGVLTLALMPSGVAPSFAWSSLFNHVAAFTALAGLMATGWPRLPAWAAALVLMALGGAIEVTQGFEVFSRHPDWIDVAANGVGVALGLSLAFALRTVRTHLMGALTA